MSDSTAKFLDEFSRSLSAQSFVKLTLSNYKGAEQHLQKVSARLIATKKGERLFVQYRHDTRDVAKNYDVQSAARQIRTLLESGFRSGHLFTTSNDFQLTIGKKSSRLVSGKPTFTERPAPAHDREKQSLINPDVFYLKALGIATDNGEIRAQQQDKWRQINKYVEILGSLFDKSSLKGRQELRIIDMGSGKGYLTFAAYDYFANSLGINVKLTGVDTNQNLVDFCSEVARSGGFDGLEFVNGNIADTDIGDVDILIALHACDTATDDALYKGITGNTEIIIAAPCCHKEVRRQMRSPAVLQDILKHGTMLEREAETITDGLRSMLLEKNGYSTKIFEFVPVEHTPKNNMIVATRRGSGREDRTLVQERIEAVKSFYGIAEQRLENLLA